MKIEKINENKIKCTLDREDLDSRNLVLAEFAYGSEKTRRFFRELMEKAEDEVGFSVSDLPLMIEAVPVSDDGIVLFITRIDDPQELDTRFSHFTSRDDIIDIDDDDLYDDEEEDDDEDDDDGNAGVIDVQASVRISPDALEDADDPMEAVTAAINEALGSIGNGKSKTAEISDFTPLHKSVEKVDGSSADRRSENRKTVRRVIYLFDSFEDVCGASGYLGPDLHADNDLYKDTDRNVYYLSIEVNDQYSEELTKAMSVLSEYGSRVKPSYATESYLREHDTLVVAGNAVQTLSAL